MTAFLLIALAAAQLSGVKVSGGTTIRSATAARSVCQGFCSGYCCKQIDGHIYWYICSAVKGQPYVCGMSPDGTVKP